MKKAAYVGAGHDIIPIIVMPHIAEFIYIDSRPQTEYGVLLPNRSEFYDKSFVPRLERVLQNNNFALTVRQPNYLEFTNSSQVLKYHINTTFPKINDDVKAQLAECEHLIVCGHDPDKSILKFMPNLKNIWCNTHTVYNMPEKEYSEKELNASTFRELRTQPNKYKYWLMKERKPYEYWDHNNIVPAIKDNYEVIEINSPMAA